jgi:hypothetical protein
MQKIAINVSKSYESGFILSERAIEYLTERCDREEINRCVAPGIRPEYRVDSYFRQRRNHPLLIQMIDELGSDAVSDFNSSIEVIEIPDGVEWLVNCNQDGYEWITEKSRSWLFKEKRLYPSAA